MDSTIDPDAARRFERLYHAYVDRVYRYALRRAPHDAEEIVSETFLIAWRRGASVPRDPLPWLLGVARRVLANRRRGERRDVALAAELTTHAQAAAPDLGDRIAATDAVAGALARLPERDRELLLLLAWEGLNHAEIGRVVECSTANVAVRLHRARRRFARELERGATTPEPLTLSSLGDAHVR